MLLAFAIAATLNEGGFAIKVPALKQASDLRAGIIERRVELEALQRGYEDAIDHCRAQLRLGKQVTCPHFNDVSAYDGFARKYGYGSGAAVRTAQQEVISARTVARLRSFARRGECPKFLRSDLSAVCREMLDDEAPTVGELGGFLNAKAARALKKAKITTLNDRIDQMRQARDRSNRRQNITRPTIKR